MFVRGGDMGARIVLVAEQRDFLKSLAACLREAGYEVVMLGLSPQVQQEVQTLYPELVIYGCDIPYGPVDSAFARLRDALDIPLLVFGTCHDETFVVNALRLGADGCLCKSYGDLELMARVEAHLRRHWEWRENPEQVVSDEVYMSEPSRSVLMGEKEVKLTPTEYRLLDQLVERDGQVVTREELCDYVWGTNGENIRVERLNPYIYYLRKKLERDPHRPEFIMTKWGSGYYLSRRIRRA
jgi:two-component system, OmpR family, KDP operon response regulator KdpE